MINIENISRPFKGDISVPGDKSISHRAIMISSLASGQGIVKNLLLGQDCRSTIDALKDMGVDISVQAGQACIKGNGLRGLIKPAKPLYIGNSGTTMRLLLGILAGQVFETHLTGDGSLSKRPMKRVTEPLAMMGAQIKGKDNANLAPITIKGLRRLKPIDYKTHVASAQVKSAIMLAALYADGTTKITEPFQSRDHTERMLSVFGVDVSRHGLSVSVKGLDKKELMPQTIEVPGDISSAAFFIALGVSTRGSLIKIKNCGINPTRIGIITALKRMGAEIQVTNNTSDFEPRADIIVRGSCLKAIEIDKEDIPLMIDEIPLIALCATQAQGSTRINGIDELRVKETDRVASILTNLQAFGADIRLENDCLVIQGPLRLKGACVEGFGDHRTAMMSVIAGYIAEGKTSVSDTECIDVSFPGFMDTLLSLSRS
jgi:3-phosphoshikimate 1-carboxyvinyltransferase